ncbi:Glutamate-1-semialdehyde 2,1-aminomutase,glutamate-1-semialdehyde aminotransferase,Glutamate-1-semialdehyde aminotransferase,glutamate-1-semialdehyde-2,1-aminomutase,Aminotransferase class-III [Chlamydia poikilotherma]|uniref:Glutamate-1-semialdehyde 2,1-aminomutase n=1 Tax=Chlamydia poikilotherma TaxID=1967783 RepID=A0A3B0Q889_9CHLA|nr:aspartate aminotransferase family protein [Chlamydia poikilotherma]SYX09097.1 Glutamate-1-semialdehyde 2,1-aminomutase,glutamate-1-semialdehyde aminotransferase,Glutamate-1-semialdehyde aminotransferase,glutamate-1-semialdehyde-2,1-aminomutase,Aminotransferase class-III [Chlamydia poikilotherma]
MPVIDETTMTYADACRYFPGGVNSPIRACIPVGIVPPIVSSASGDVFIDSFGKNFIDFCGSWGSLIHGHSHPKILDAICTVASQGTSYGLTSENEISLASTLFSCLKLQDHKLRFVSSGTEATMTSVRLACGATKRSVIIKFLGCYHGHADILLKGISIDESNLMEVSLIVDRYFSSNPCLPLTLILPYNDVKVFEEVMQQIGERVACVIFEPIAINMGVILPESGWVENIINTSRRYSALSIMDEVVTGFRMGIRGMRSIIDAIPDITVYGKILGGGMPVAALLAHQNIMDHLMPLGTVFQAGTLSGNPIAMAAGKASIELCQEIDFYPKLENLTEEFLSPIEDTIRSKGFPVVLVKAGSMFSLFFREVPPKNLYDVQQCDQKTFGVFYRHAFSRGVYLSPASMEASFISAVHSKENLAYTQNVLIDSLIKTFESI